MDCIMGDIMTLQELIDRLLELKEDGIDPKVTVQVLYYDTDFGGGFVAIDSIRAINDFGQFVLRIEG